MANHKSALKKAKQDLVRRDRNRAGKSKLRTALKKFRAGLAENPENMQGEFTQLQALIDRSAKHGFIHQNAAARLKSRLSLQVQKSN